ncbi:MAG: PAS domain S-box protein [Planctomycetes bacterium]|nr:PAS domain S-box protein [Planctomycetota bacterium]
MRSADVHKPTVSGPRGELPHARRGHLRLILFFGAVTIAGTGLGVWGLRSATDEHARELVLIAAVAGTAAVAFIGVLYHRLKIIHWRWRETEEYLARIRAESAKYRSVLEGAADLLLLVDPDDTLVHEKNAAAREILGLDSSTAKIELTALVAPGDRERVRAALHRALEIRGEPVTLGELRVRGRDEQWLAVDARVGGIELATERRVLVALRDLSAQKQMERRLEIHERLSSLGLLTAGVAHEINNPLEGIGNYLKLLERDGLEPEQRARYVANVQHGFGRIRDIARDLLRFARPKDASERLDFALAVERAVELVKLADRLRGVQLELRVLDRPLWVVGDSGRLEQVIVNLVINAATASGPQGHAWITARHTSERGVDNVELCVEDDGPGIPPEDLQRIFDPFVSSTGGTGLGLAVSYGIVSAHGGELVAANRAERGACFTLRLPWSPDGAPERARSQR